MLRHKSQLQLLPLLLRCKRRNPRSKSSQQFNHRCQSHNKRRRLTLNKTRLSIFQSQWPQFSFIPNQREGITSFFTVLFRTLDFTCTFIFTFFSFYFLFLSDFTLCTLVLFYLYIFTFYIFTLPILLLLSQKQTTLKKGRDITADILDPVLQPDPTLITRAFWCQNTRIHFT